MIAMDKLYELPVKWVAMDELERIYPRQMKYSIIIVAYKAEEYLQACLDSIKCSRSKDYEIIIVDNSPEPLFDELELDASLGFRYVYNHKNIGFAAACNVGVKMAKGKFICLLNPDTLVYGDWLERMSRYLVEEGGPCHAVGPVSNMAAGLQHHRLMLPTYPSRQEWKPCPTKVLIGFCFMMAKKTWESLDGMDPGCFLGCDDLDISWRMQLKGMRLGVASDVYVHHECHKSFEANPESEKLIKQSEEYLKAKLITHYGEGNVPTATELWGADFMDTGAKPTVSVCMIANDKDLWEALTPIHQMGFCHQIVLTDTSKEPNKVPSIYASPGTGESAFTFVTNGKEFSFPKSNKNKILSRFPWIDDFAAARNHSLSHCTGDWVIWLDADDRIPQDTIDQMQTESFRRLLQKHRTMLRFKVRNVGKSGEVFEEFMQTRMFRRTESHWEGRIHEHLVMDGHTVQDCPTLIIDHTGYSDEATVAAKSERNLNLLAMEPDSSDTWMHRAHCYGMVGKWAKAAQCFENAMQGAAQDAKDFLNYQVGICFENMSEHAEAAKRYAASHRADGLCRLAEMAYRQGLPYAAPLFFQFLQEAEKEDLGRFVSHTSSLITHAHKRLKELENGTT